MYMALVDDAVRMIQSRAGDSRDTLLLDDAATWTIVGTERIEYAFVLPREPISIPVTPVPLVEYIKVWPGALCYDSVSASMAY
jgi:hypothetical protein